MKENIIEIKSLLNEIGVDHYTRIIPNGGLGSKYITAKTIVKLYILTNKLFNRNNQPSTCVTCIINNINDLIDYILLNDLPIVEDKITPLIEEKPLKKGK
jgi:hypothetical protein